MRAQSSNSWVSTEEFFEVGYECTGIWQEAIMDYLKGAIQEYAWEENKPVEVLRRSFVSRDLNGYLWIISLYANVFCKQTVKGLNNRTSGQ